MYRKMKFNGIGPDEKIIKVIHRNWFDIISQYFIVFLTLSFFLFAFMMYQVIFPELGDEKYNLLFLFITNSFILATWIYCFLIWIDYYFDIWIMTSEKIINIEQKGLFIRRVSEVKYEKIQDVSVEVSGLPQTIINFGDVNVQTAADNNNIIFRKVSSPYEIKNLIVGLQKKKEYKKSHDFEEAIKEGLSST